MYSGPKYFIHLKYAGFLNVLYVTCLYGVGLPILFPIAALYYLILWMHERWHLAYYHRRPASMDATLTENGIHVASFAPILLLFNGYWMLTN